MLYARVRFLPQGKQPTFCDDLQKLTSAAFDYDLNANCSLIYLQNNASRKFKAMSRQPFHPSCLLKSPISCFYLNKYSLRFRPDQQETVFDIAEYYRLHIALEQIRLETNQTASQFFRPSQHYQNEIKVVLFCTYVNRHVMNFITQMAVLKGSTKIVTDPFCFRHYCLLILLHSPIILFHVVRKRPE